MKKVSLTHDKNNMTSGLLCCWDCLKQKLLADCQTPFWRTDVLNDSPWISHVKLQIPVSLTFFLGSLKSIMDKNETSLAQRIDLKLLIVVIPLTIQHISFTPAIPWNNPEPGSGLNLGESTGKESIYSFLLAGRHDVTFWNQDHQNRIGVKTVSCKNILNNTNSTSVSAFTVFLSMAIARMTRHVKLFHSMESGVLLHFTWKRAVSNHIVSNWFIEIATVYIPIIFLSIAINNLCYEPCENKWFHCVRRWGSIYL